MNVIIPMSGMGKRFVNAGYKEPKPFIPVEGKPIIQHILEKFSVREDSFLFGINEQHDRTTMTRPFLTALAPSSKIVAMAYQPGGPVDSVRQLFAHIKDEEPAIVNYCDFNWVWDYKDFQKTVKENGCDGAVICYTGFHPHLLGPNKYATLDSDGLWMKEIREKHSWHDNKQKDWTSSGTYYFKKGSYIKKYFEAITKRDDLKINGEHYVSQVFQLMKEDGLKIFIYQIPFMLQWGTPEDLQEYQYWSDYFQKKAAAKRDAETYEMEVLVLMAGAGKRFSDAGYTLPKPFIPVDGGMMVEKSALSLPRGSRYVFVTREELRHEEREKKLVELFAPAKILSLKTLTEGQACTALTAKPELNLDKPLLIAACDHTLFYNAAKFKQMTAPGSIADALIFTYRNNPNVKRNPQAYGWVDADESGLAKKVSVKVPLPGDPMKHHAIIGSFWFRQGKLFTENAEKMIKENSRINNEFYIDQAMNYLITAGLKIFVFEADEYISWGTPDDLKTYEYWQRYFETVKSKK